MTKSLLFAITIAGIASLRAIGSPASAQSLQYRLSEPASQSRRTVGQSSSPAVLAIRNVTIVPVTGAQPMANATVLIRNEHIVAIGRARKLLSRRPACCEAPVSSPSRLHRNAGAHSKRVPRRRAVRETALRLPDTGGDHEELVRWRRTCARPRVGRACA